MLVSMLVGTVHAEVKIAVVNVSRVMQAHPETAQAEDLLSKEAEEFEAEKKASIEKLKAMHAEFEETKKQASSRVLSEAGKEEKVAEAREKLIALQEAEQEVRMRSRDRQAQLAELGDRMRRRIVEKILTLVDAYAKDKGYTLVLDTSNRGLNGVESVVYASDALDITDAIIERVQDDEKKASPEKSE